MTYKANGQNFGSGAFVISRSIFESEIWYKPPEYLKIWLYLIGKANHKGRKYGGFFCERGQYFCSYSELSEQLKYNIGFVNKTYSDSRMKNLMKYLRSTLMVTTVKNPRGILITITNYDSYQDLSNYENPSEKTSEETMKKPRINQKALSINKNDKELKNEKNLNNTHMCGFKEFWKTYPTRNGKKLEKDKALKEFQLQKQSDIQMILKAVKNYAESKEVRNGIGIKNAHRFLKDNYWKEWLELERKENRNETKDVGGRAGRASENSNKNYLDGTEKY